MLTERVTHVEGAWKAIEEGWALVEQEPSTAKEACHTLAWELDSLSMKNNDLQGELEVGFKELVMLRSNPLACRAPL